MRQLLFAFLFLSLLAQVWAGPRDSTDYALPTHVLKVMPSGFINPFHRIYSGSYEFIIPGGPGFELEVAAIGPVYRGPFGDVSGYMIRPSFRRYGAFSGDEQQYLAFQPFYKNFTTNYTDWITINCEDATRRYEQYKTVRYRQTALGLNVLAGYVSGFQEGNCFFLLDAYVGFGVRYREYYSADFTSKECIPGDLKGFGGLERGWLPTVQAGLKLGFGYRFFK